MWILYLLIHALADQKTHNYSLDEEVILWFNKIVPFNNPQESYAYNKLPLCRGERKERLYSQALGEAVEGYELYDSEMDIKFMENIQIQPFCSKNLNHEAITILVNAIKRNFWIQMYIDDLPFWSEIGKEDEKTKDIFIFTHYAFIISYNNTNIIKVQSIPGNLIRIYDNKKSSRDVTDISFTYSISWVPTNTKFRHRFDSYLDPGFFENNVHWFSIINSFVMVILLCGIVMLILYRTLNKDIERYESQNDEPMDLAISSGWKQVAGDVFRPPDMLLFFTALYSTGWILAVMIAVCIVACILHPMYSERGTFTEMMILTYSFLGIIGGFRCGEFYCKNQGKRWKLSLCFSALLYPTFIAIIELLLNCIAVMYSSLQAISIFSMLEILSLILGIYFPLFVIGNLAGRKYRQTFPVIQKINCISVPILKEKKWYSEPAFISLLGGLLPFGSISVEIYFIFTSFWNYKFYYVYGFAFVGYSLFILSLICVSIVATYIILNSEDYRWHWVSFISSGSVGIYLYVYSFYYYFFKTNMTGLFQFSFYFGYTGLASITVFLIAGAIGYTGSQYFVRRIYKNIKFD